ncbi:hypothetical protein BTUL_0170g00150 [Botrytis tulipae]|uniref:Uncharacterized protein n=1 Tax=Botrytis tulipae TaxID=87230 RepID=A0A4Z1EAQ9_9HELO|nr:hypothetical protein BTUL_0170g00150 [Botrytis tulipae]
MRGGRPNLQLGESWIVEGNQEDYEEYLPPSEAGYDRRTRSSVPQRPTRGSNRSPEPEFVMPSLDAETLEASWSQAQSTSRSPRRFQESQRRNSRHDQNLESSNIRLRTQPTQNRSSLAPPTANSHSPHHPNSDAKDIIATFIDHTTMIFAWILEILGGALRILRTPLSYLLAICILSGIGLVARNLVTTSIYASLSPICLIPGSSLLNLPFCSTHNTDSSKARVPVEFEQVMMVQAQFEDILRESAGGVSLPLDMKRGESFLRDLRQLVRYSQLKSRNELVMEFDGFIDTAKIASWDLTKFNSHVGRAVDSVISITRWTSRVLDGIQERETSRGLIGTFVNDKLLAPFQPTKFSERLVLDQYVEHTRAVEEEIARLVLEAQALLMVLNNLEDRLEIIHGITVRDGVQVQASKDETLSELWAWLGGHRGKINKLNGQLNLLKEIGDRRKIALAHVSGTLIKLQEISSGLEDLRERVAAPELLRDRIDIPLSVHIEHIQTGINRLEEQKLITQKSKDAIMERARNRHDMEGNLIDG